MRSHLKALPAAILGIAFIAAGASAQAPQSNPSEWNRPYGQSHQDGSQPYAGARSRAGNRVVINGIIQTGVGVSAQASAFAQGSVNFQGGVQNGTGTGTGYTFHQATAIANQLNVVVNGNYNTVVVNSRQINSGQITANAGQASASAGQAQATGDSDND